MRRAFAVAILLLVACGSASDEKVGATARGVPAKGGLQDLIPGKVFVRRGSETGGSETAPHDLDADGAACGEKAGGNLGLWAGCMLELGWRLEPR